MGLLFLALMVMMMVTAAVALNCNAGDLEIYRARGDTFERDFRGLGGLFVSRSEFEQGVIRLTGLSEQCASCYGGAYICGWRECKGSCMMQGLRCDACLSREGCTAELATCTGGFGQPALR